MHGQPYAIERRAQHTVPPTRFDPHIIATFQLSHLSVSPLQHRFATRHHHPLPPRLVIPFAIALAERHDPLNSHRLTSRHGCGKQCIEHLTIPLLRRGRRHNSSFIVQISHKYIYCGYGSHRPAHSLAPLAFPLRATHRRTRPRSRAILPLINNTEHPPDRADTPQCVSDHITNDPSGFRPRVRASPDRFRPDSSRVCGNVQQ